MRDSTQSVDSQGKQMYNQLLENWRQIQDDVKIIGDENARQSDKLKGFVHLIRDFLAMFYTATSVFNVNAHPNIIDIAGQTLTKMFVETDTGGIIDPEQSRLAISYFTMIAYASVFIFIAYVASENWYYFLFYGFSEDIMTNITDKDGNKSQQEWSLGVWWSYYEEKKPNLFGLFHAVFYMVTAMDSMFRKLREFTKGEFDNYSPVIRVLLFMGIYYWFNYWVSMTSSAAFEIIFLIIMGFAVFRVCMLSYGSFSFAPASVYYPPSMFSLVIFIIKALVLWTLDYSLISIGKMAVYAYIMFISFGLISFSETKRTNRGVTGRFFDAVREMRDYLLLNARQVSKSDDFPIWLAKYVEVSWLSISVFLIFLIMLMTLISQTKDVRLFAPLYYFILIFLGCSAVKTIINWFKMSDEDTKIETDMKVKTDKYNSTLSQNNFTTKEGPDSSRFDTKNTLYESGFGRGIQVGKDLFNNKLINPIMNPRETFNTVKESLKRPDILNIAHIANLATRS